MMAERENFLSRWSQRKLNRRHEELREESAVPAPLPAFAEPESASSGHAATSLPPLDALDESSDYSAFLAPDVGEELRRLALRKLFGSAGFNVRDGLDDYDEDYRTFEALGETVTAEMRHRMARELGAVHRPDDAPGNDEVTATVLLDVDNAASRNSAPPQDEGEEPPESAT